MKNHFNIYQTFSKKKKKGTKTQQQLQYKAMKILVRIEAKYVGLLKLLIEEYMEPCRKHAKGKKKLKSFNNIFIDVDIIYEHHKSFLALLERYLAVWPRCQGIGKVITDQINSFKIYERYVERIPGSKQALSELKGEKKSLLSIISKIDTERKKNWNNPHHVFRNFRTLLKLPLTHLIEYKYPLKVYYPPFLFFLSPFSATQQIFSVERARRMLDAWRRSGTFLFSLQSRKTIVT